MDDTAQPKKSRRGGARAGAGRKPFQPTADQRSIVKTLAGFGVPHDGICTAVLNPKTGKPIDHLTLEKHFRAELDQGVIEANVKVAGTLFRMATQENNVAAAIFWLKSRAKWREVPQSIEVSGPNGQPVQQETSLTVGKFEEIARKLANEI